MIDPLDSLSVLPEAFSVSSALLSIDAFAVVLAILPLTFVLLSVDPRLESALPPALIENGTAPIAGKLADDAGYAVLRRVLSRWCGQHAYDLPVVLAVDSLGRVEMVQRGALWPEEWLRVL